MELLGLLNGKNLGKKFRTVLTSKSSINVTCHFKLSPRFVCGLADLAINPFIKNTRSIKLKLKLESLKMSLVNRSQSEKKASEQLLGYL